MNYVGELFKPKEIDSILHTLLKERKLKNSFMQVDQYVRDSEKWLSGKIVEDNQVIGAAAQISLRRITTEVAKCTSELIECVPKCLQSSQFNSCVERLRKLSGIPEFLLYPWERELLE